MADRIVTPEILDSLPANDPQAIRSRRDLTMINALMGNDRWVCGVLQNFRDSTARGIVEIGAGDGGLVKKLARQHPNAQVTAYDFLPPPANLPEQMIWHQGDIFEAQAPVGGGVLVANLFLHHFEKVMLTKLAEWLENFEVLVFNEPDRHWRAVWLARFLNPWVNCVTQHDMRVSIEAGFSKGEMLQALGLDNPCWRHQETSTWRGARRVIAWRV